MPFLETVDILPLDVIPIQIRTPDVLTHGGVPILADATAQVKIDSSDASIHIAAEHFLGMGKDGIRDVAVAVLEGKMREVIGTMTVEEIYRGRREFDKSVAEAAHEDFSKMGLVLLSFSLKEFSDTQGYIDALTKPLISAAKQRSGHRRGRKPERRHHPVVPGPQGRGSRPPPGRSPDRQGPMGERSEEGRVPGHRQPEESPCRLRL